MRRYRDRRIEGKRLPIHEKVLTAPPVARPRRAPRIHPQIRERCTLIQTQGADLHCDSLLPESRDRVVEPHIVKSADAISLKPMTIEEAVKDTEFRDRDLLIFRNPSGAVSVRPASAPQQERWNWSRFRSISSCLRGGEPLRSIPVKPHAHADLRVTPRLRLSRLSQLPVMYFGSR